MLECQNHTWKSSQETNEKTQRIIKMLAMCYFALFYTYNLSFKNLNSMHYMLRLMSLPRNQVDINNIVKLMLCLNHWNLNIVLLLSKYLNILYQTGTLNSDYTLIRRLSISENILVIIVSLNYPELHYDFKFSVKVH